MLFRVNTMQFSGFFTVLPSFEFYVTTLQKVLR